jgi:hypothetical protein
MASDGSADGKNSLVGEFLLALARAPAPVQEAIILNGLKIMLPHAKSLIHPYPMLNHMLGIINRQGALGTTKEPQDG